MTGKHSKMRWALLGMLFLSTVLNYLDRQTLSILAPLVQRDLKMTDLDYAWVVQLFLIAYTFAYLVSGRITDWLGAKWSLALFVGWWSTANMLTGLVQTTAQLGAARTALGLGEAGNYTAGPKVVSERFPPEERAFAFGTYTAGAMVGATIAPPLLGWLAVTQGWRAAFVITGALGIVWVVLWLAVYARAPAIAVPPLAVGSERGLWRTIATDRMVWSFALARMVADPVWYFYLFWFPKYLGDDRGMTLIGVASVAWLVYLAADVGSIGGGYASGRLIKRGYTPERARMMMMAGAVALIPLGGLIAFEPSISVTLALAGLVAGAHMVFQINMGTLIVDTYPPRVVATVFGLIAAGSGMGGILSTGVVGRLVTANSYDAVFLIMAALHPIAFFIVWLGYRTRARSIAGMARFA